MNAQTLSDLKDKPLFTLTVEQFLELQQSVPVKDSSTKADDMPPKIIGKIKQFAASLRIFPPRFQRRQKIRAEAEPVFNNRKLISSLPSLGQPVSAQKNKTGLFISPVFGCINIAELGAVSTAPVVKRNFPLSNSHIDA